MTARLLDVEDVPIARTVDVPDADTVMIDFGADGQVVGVELAARPVHADWGALFNAYPDLKETFALVHSYTDPVAGDGSSLQRISHGASG